MPSARRPGKENRREHLAAKPLALAATPYQFVLWHLGSLDLRGIIKRGERSLEGMFCLFTDSLADTIDHMVHRVAEDLAKLAGLESIPASRHAA
jgi:hypothetical protein